MNDEIYIGYEKKAPPGVKRVARLVIIALIILMPVMAFMVTSGQKGFTTSAFEFGKLTQMEGYLYKKPIPMLRVQGDRDSYGNPVYTTFPLVNLGKLGIDDIIDNLEKDGMEVAGQLVLLEGTLIYYDGKALFELSNQEASVLEISSVQDEFAPSVLNLGEVKIRGEIIDPKCYFGVMKPGENKPHRSCATRCISGGIPPVLMTTDSLNRRSYYIMAGINEEPINQKVLPYVAEQVEVSGQLVLIDDWWWLFTAPDITRLSY